MSDDNKQHTPVPVKIRQTPATITTVLLVPSGNLLQTRHLSFTLGDQLDNNTNHEAPPPWSPSSSSSLRRFCTTPAATATVGHRVFHLTQPTSAFFLLAILNQITAPTPSCLVYSSGNRSHCRPSLIAPGGARGAVFDVGTTLVPDRSGMASNRVREKRYSAFGSNGW
jgi:hypothetical protein